MSAVSKFPEAEAAVAAWEQAETTIRSFLFPALIEAKITDDGETYDALRCPWCDAVITGDNDVSAVDMAERWNASTEIDDEDFQHKQLPFYFDADSEFGDTLYYRTGCCEKPVDLPDGWAAKSAW
jgi:hypothetical protein